MGLKAKGQPVVLVAVVMMVVHSSLTLAVAGGQATGEPTQAQTARQARIVKRLHEARSCTTLPRSGSSPRSLAFSF